MPLSQHQRAQMRACCGEIQEEDGLDPRLYFKSRSGRDKPHRKTQQLCRQVAQTLSLVLSGEFADELLQSLIVESVTPAPNATQLQVSVRFGTPDDAPPETAMVLERLERVSGRLRSEVAAAITRKRAPRLIFQVLRQPDPVAPSPPG